MPEGYVNLRFVTKHNFTYITHTMFRINMAICEYGISIVFVVCFHMA
jgi:hypothetical protein